MAHAWNPEQKVKGIPFFKKAHEISQIDRIHRDFWGTYPECEMIYGENLLPRCVAFQLRYFDVATRI